MDCFSQIFSRSLQAEIAVKKLIHMTAEQTVLLGALNGVFVLVFLAQFQLIYSSHILFSGCTKDVLCVTTVGANFENLYFTSVVTRFRCVRS